MMLTAMKLNSMLILAFQAREGREPEHPESGGGRGGTARCFHHPSEPHVHLEPHAQPHQPHAQQPRVLRARHGPAAGPHQEAPARGARQHKGKDQRLRQQPNTGNMIKNVLSDTKVIQKGLCHCPRTTCLL